VRFIFSLNWTTIFASLGTPRIPPSGRFETMVGGVQSRSALQQLPLVMQVLPQRSYPLRQRKSHRRLAAKLQNGCAFGGAEAQSASEQHWPVAIQALPHLLPMAQLKSQTPF
jgi:hypothetical protein